MNAISTVSFSRYANVFSQGLAIEDLRQRVPAVFASAAHESLSSKYTFIPTERVLTGLMSAGFVPVDARQALCRKGSPIHARHVVRLRRRFETVALRDAVPEVVFLNSHDGTSAYLRWILQCHHRGQKMRQSPEFRGINANKRIQ